MIGKKTIDLVGNSDENILKVLEESNLYFTSHDEISSKINNALWVLRCLEDLLPQTVDNFWSGHMFPIVEAVTELESSIQLCKFGFYKHAFISLRSILELGLLSVYWDIDDKSHIDIQNWLQSFESTPDRNKTIFSKLKTNSNIRAFDQKQKIFSDINYLFGELSNFVHTKGRKHSIMNLDNANFNRFNEKSLSRWTNIMLKVVTDIVIIHILKYPIALQYTPIEAKFGINGPAGKFLEPYQYERLKRFFKDNIATLLQEISDNDLEAQSLREWVEQQPDISKEELQQQIDEIEKLTPHLDQSSK